MALVSKTFSQIITFTRASTATYFDATGTLQSAAIDAPRFDYDPATLAAQGFLIEEARTNLLTYSADFGDAIWAKFNVTVTTNTGTAPDGTSSADLILPDATVGNHRIRQDSSITSGTTYSNSIYFKAAGYDWIYIQLSTGFDGGGALYRNVNISNGTLGSGTLGANDVTVTPINNGWYRVNITRVATATATGRINWLVQNADAATASFAGDGVSGVLAWGAQLEAGAFPTSYIPTTTTALTRAADVASVNTLSPWYNASAGTLYSEFAWEGLKSTSGQAYAQFDDGSTNNRIVAAAGSSNANIMTTTSGGTSDGSTSTPATVFAANTIYKTALALAANDLQSFVNGTAGTADTTVTLPVGLTNLKMGASLSATSNVWLRRLTYYPRRLSQAEGIAITA